MAEHFHVPSQDDPIEAWSADRMRRHLRDVHLMHIPMFWDIGRLHAAHLQGHLTPTPPTENVQETARTVDDIEQATMDVARRIRLDRVVAALCGLGFDQDWTSDDGIGANVRGALRRTHESLAQRVLGALDSAPDDARQAEIASEVQRRLADHLADLRTRTDELIEERDRALGEEKRLRARLDVVTHERDAARVACDEASARSNGLVERNERLNAWLKRRSDALSAGRERICELIEAAERAGLPGLAADLKKVAGMPVSTGADAAKEA